MRSRISFFNFRLFWKDVSRFWPVWGSYLALWTLLGPLTLLGDRYTYARDPLRAVNYVLNLGYIGGVVMGAIFGLLAVMAVWSFACRARSAHAMACLPIRREGMFTALSLAGLLPLLAANVVTALLLFLVELLIGCVDWLSLGQFLALSSLPLLFYFGFAVFCAQLTGNILVLPALYILLNFLVPGLELLARGICGMFVYGMGQDLANFSLLALSPPIAMFRYGGVGIDRYAFSEQGQLLTRAEVRGWGMLGIYAALGVVFLVLALLLYRRRRMESAGDVVAVNVLKPVFRWCMAIGCAMGLGLLLFAIIGDALFNMTQMTQLLSLVLLMFVGAFVGWFVAQMLIQKSFRVFRGHWAGYGVCCLVIALAMFAMEFDLLGYERHVPAPEKIENVAVYCGGDQVVLALPENLEAVTALQRSIVDNKELHESGQGSRAIMLSLDYQLRSGRSLHRLYALCYDVAQPGDAGTLQTLINCPEAVSFRKQPPFPLNADTITDGHVQVLISAGEGAAIDGYESPEDWILAEVCGYSAEELALLDETARQEALLDAVIYYAYNSMDYQAWQEDWPGVTAETSSVDMIYESDDMSRLPIQDPEAYAALQGADLSRALFYRDWNFSSQELADLYENCILPDMNDGSLGRVYVLDDDAYYNEATNTKIYIGAVQSPRSGGGYSGEEAGDRLFSYNTVPTVDAHRTNAWLEAHGIPVHRLAETLRMDVG